MESPPVRYNQELYDYIREIPRNKREDMVCDLEHLGGGASGTTFLAYMKPRRKFKDQVVLKEQPRNRYCNNERQALKYLTDKMRDGELPGYYIFMYATFPSGKNQYIIMEKADKCLDALCIEHNLSTDTYLKIFWHIANAVDCLEKLHFNHGDLWSENVMIVWDPDQDNIPEVDRSFTIKLIDYDSAYKDRVCTQPSFGGATKFRTKFLLGYDLNRFFDGLLFSYENYIEKKTAHKKDKIKHLQKLQKKGKKVVIPKLYEQDDSDEEYDRANVIYPSEIIDLMYSFNTTDPDDFTDLPHLSGSTVKTKIEEYLF